MPASRTANRRRRQADPGASAWEPRTRGDVTARRDVRGRHGWGGAWVRATPCVPGLASGLLNNWVVLRGRSAEDLLLRGHGMSVHQHFPLFEKMASFQPVKTAPQVK